MQVLAEVAVVKAEVVMVKTKEAVVKADVGRNRTLLSA
jgi:hypothetical protein